VREREVSVTGRAFAKCFRVLDVTRNGDESETSHFSLRPIQRSRVEIRKEFCPCDNDTN
jgi:hypothetical protein